jgi:methylated-DNA-[protein]-cysteine S-methyltransferase
MNAMKAKRLLEKCKLTKFQKDVLIATLAVPRGETRTYKEIAIAANRPRAYRAVGTALRLNPLAPSIPCHRVVRSDGDIGNYSASGGRKTKERLLRLEGAL